MSKFTNSIPSLKQFVLQGEVKKLYRQILRAIKEVPDENSKKELREWARTDFKNNKHHTDELVIKMMIQHGQKSLKELRSSIDLSK